MPRGHGKRCSGFRTEDGKYELCSREELAGGIEPNSEGLYAHLMSGDCWCGGVHGGVNVIRPDFGVNRRAEGEIEAIYDYRDESGALLFQVVRKTGKRFLQRRPYGADWIWHIGQCKDATCVCHSLPSIRRVPYRLIELLAADPKETVYIPEGEKDVDSLVARGYVATCNPGGAGTGKWDSIADVARTALSGRNVIIVADNDGPCKKHESSGAQPDCSQCEPGKKHALAIADSLRPVVSSVRIVRAPEPYKDVTELLQAGGKVEDLQEPNQPTAPTDPWSGLVSKVTREWYETPPPARTWLLRDSSRDNSPGVLPLGKVGQIIAEGGAGKTMVVTQLAVAVATGTLWAGSIKVDNPGRVLMLLGEEDEEEAHRRLYRAVQYAGRTPPDGSIVVMPLAGVTCPLIEKTEKGNWVDTSFLKWIRDDRPWNDVRLIIVDPLSRFAGEAETDNSVGTRFIQALESIAVVSRATVIVTHHTNKISRGPDGRVEASSGRGSSSLVDGVRWQAALSAKTDNGKEFVTLAFTKSNYSRRPEPILLQRMEEGSLVPVPESEAVAMENAATAAKTSAQEAKEKAKRDAQEARQRADREAAKERAKQKAEEQERSNAADDEALRQILTEFPGILSKDLENSMRARLNCGERRVGAAVSRVGVIRVPHGKLGAKAHYLPGSTEVTQVPQETPEGSSEEPMGDRNPTKGSSGSPGNLGGVKGGGTSARARPLPSEDPDDG